MSDGRRALDERTEEFPSRQASPRSEHRNFHILIVAGLLLIGSAQAVHDNGMFELDGNVVHNSATTPPYD